MNVFQSIVVLFFLQLLLIGCVANNWTKGSEDTMTVTWLRVSDVDKTCRGLIQTSINGEILGCAAPYKGNCSIYTPELGEVDGEETTTLGHELAHCFGYNYDK